MRFAFGWGVDESSGPFSGRPVVGERGGYRPYFENYTVDASIFEMIPFGGLSRNR
jgi:hypothetical protein